MDIESLGGLDLSNTIASKVAVTASDLKRHKKQINCSIIARVLLRNFDRSQLVHTKSGNLDKRSKKNKFYLKLVELSVCDELGDQKTKKELYSLFPTHKDGSLDLSYKVNRDYLQAVIETLC